jgi:hypothetical protein
VFGGYTSRLQNKAKSSKTSSNILLHDIWRFDLKSRIWTQLSSTSSPSTRFTNLKYRHIQLGQEVSGRSALLSPYGLILLGGLSSYTKEYNNNRIHDNVWRMDLWNENYEKIDILLSQSETKIQSSNQGRDGVPPHHHRNVGKLSELGEEFPFLKEDSMNTGRYLSSFAWVDDYSLSRLEKQEYFITNNEHTIDLLNNPSIFSFGGQDKGRNQLDDIRKLNLQGLASEPFIQDNDDDVDIIFKRESISNIRSSHCDWWLLPNSTSDHLWQSTCLSSGYYSQNCTLPLVLRRAWCRGEYQSVGFL